MPRLCALFHLLDRFFPLNRYAPSSASLSPQIIDPRIETDFEEVIDGKFRRLVCHSVQMKHKGMYKCQCAALSSSGRVNVNSKSAERPKFIFWIFLLVCPVWYHHGNDFLYINSFNYLLVLHCLLNSLHNIIIIESR